MSKKLKVGDKVIIIKVADQQDDPYGVGDIGTIKELWENKRGAYIKFDGKFLKATVYLWEINHWCEGYQSPLWKVLNGV